MLCCFEKNNLCKFLNIHLPKTSPYCNGFRPRGLFCFFFKCKMVAFSSPKKNSKLWCNWCRSPSSNAIVMAPPTSSPNVKLVLSSSPQVTQRCGLYFSISSLNSKPPNSKWDLFSSKAFVIAISFLNAKLALSLSPHLIHT